MKVLVTGGAGFIGSSLVHVLLSAGHEVGIIDDLSTGSMGNLHPYAWFRRLDIRDQGLGEAVAAFGPDAVVHLAAQVDVARSIADPELDRSINVDGTRVVCRAAIAAGARRIISASSAAVYGEPEVVPVPETAAKRPSNPYGASKLAAESVLMEEAGAAGIDHASVRFANVYGPRQSWLGEGGVVAIFAHHMSAGEAPVIFGDGRQTRDFIYVGDVVSALLTAVTHEGSLAGAGPDGPAYNISTGQQRTVEELAAALRPLTSYFGAIAHEPARDGDIVDSALDPTKAASTFGWSAGVPLEQGLAMTVAWMRSRA